MRRKATKACCKKFFEKCLAFQEYLNCKEIDQSKDQFKNKKRRLSPQREDFEGNKYLRLDDCSGNPLLENSVIIQFEEPAVSTPLDLSSNLDNLVSESSIIINFENMDNLPALDPRMETFMNEMRAFRVETGTSFNRFDNLQVKVENMDNRLELVESTSVNLQSSQLKITNIPLSITDTNIQVVVKILSVMGMNAANAVFDVR